MGLEQGINHGKERRKPYRKSKRFDRTCRNHGACPWCHDNRSIARRRQEEAAKAKEEDL
jgi:hypothetical protein